MPNVKAHEIELIPPERYYAMHINLIRHGREMCVAGILRCEVCPLTEVSKYYQGRREKPSSSQRKR